MKNLILLLVLAGTLTACGKKTLEEATSAVDPVEASIESGLTVVSGMSDEQAGASFAVQSLPQKTSIWEILLGPKAYAATCVRAFFSSCVSGVKSASYDACEIAGTQRTLSGDVTLSYSHMSCTLTTDGDSVTRTYDLQISGPRGGVLSHSSNVASDYRGTSYGGGGKLTKTAAGWDLDILGRHNSLAYKGKVLFNTSVRTLNPLKMTGSLSRSSRNVTGGQLEVNHNLAGFTAVFAPSNLQWSNACCHPISGSIGITYTGSKTGSATVTFDGCGSANVDQGGQQQAIQLSYCE